MSPPRPPPRQFVFTIPKVLRGIFRKRRRLLTHLFQTATDCLRDHFRTRLDLPKGRLAAAAALHTFGDYLVFHPHLHILAAILRFRGGSFEWQAIVARRPKKRCSCRRVITT